MGNLPAYSLMVSNNGECGQVNSERISISLVGDEIKTPAELKIVPTPNPVVAALHCQEGGGVCSPARKGRVVLEKFTVGGGARGSYSFDFGDGQYSGKLDAKWCEVPVVPDCWLREKARPDAATAAGPLK